MAEYAFGSQGHGRIVGMGSGVLPTHYRQNYRGTVSRSSSQTQELAQQAQQMREMQDEMQRMRQDAERVRVERMQEKEEMNRQMEGMNSRMAEFDRMNDTLARLISGLPNPPQPPPS